MPGPIPQTTTSTPRSTRLRQGRGDGQALDVGVEAGGDGDRRLQQPSRLERPHRVRERDRERASGELDVRDATPGEGGAGGRELAVEAEADDRDVVDPLEGRVVVLLGVPVRELPGRVRPRHDVRALVRREPEPAREVRVEDVEAPGAEAELGRLDVDDDDVALLDRAREPRVRDARIAVDLEADEAVDALPDRADGPPAEPERHLHSLARDVDQREGHVDHALEVVDRDVLVRRVDVRHPVREVDAGQALAR